VPQNGEDAAVEAAVASSLNSMERPPPWIDVTTALRFMVEDGRIALHPVRLLGHSVVHKRDTLSAAPRHPVADAMHTLCMGWCSSLPMDYKLANILSGSLRLQLRRLPGKASWASVIQRQMRRSTCASVCCGMVGPTPPA
jgi:hypothetical protein